MQYLGLLMRLRFSVGNKPVNRFDSFIGTTSSSTLANSAESAVGSALIKGCGLGRDGEGKVASSASCCNASIITKSAGCAEEGSLLSCGVCCGGSDNITGVCFGSCTVGAETAVLASIFLEAERVLLVKMLFSVASL